MRESAYYFIFYFLKKNRVANLGSGAAQCPLCKLLNIYELPVFSVQVK